MSLAKCSVVSLFLLATACGGVATGPSDSEEGSQALALTRLPVIGETAGIPQCTEPGVFALKSGATVACAFDAFLKIGSIPGESSLDLTLASFDGRRLPTLLATTSAGQAPTKGKKVRIEAGATGTEMTEPSAGPIPEREVAPDCDGIVVDPETGDTWVCTPELALMLPGGETAGATIPIYRIVPRAGATLIVELTLQGARGAVPRVSGTDGGILIDGTVALTAHAEMLVR